MTFEQAQAYMAGFSPEPSSDPVAARQAFEQLGCAASGVHFVTIAGAAGKTAVAHMEARILQEAGFACGLYTTGNAPLDTRICIGGAPVDRQAYLDAVAVLAGGHLSLSLAEAELAVAAACFTAARCDFAVVEMADASLARYLPDMPACAITQLGPDGTAHSLSRIAYQAAALLRKGCTAVTTPAQPKEALQEIIVAAGKADCELMVPDAEDLTVIKARRLENQMDYGGYGVTLPHAGRPAAENAAVAVELALALWRKGYEIPDEPILAGMVAAPADCGLYLLRRRPYILADPCRLPVQAASLAGVLRAESFQHLSVIAGLSACPDLDAFFSALETGFTPEEERTEKSQMPGMSDNPVDKLYLVTPEGPDACPAEKAAEVARFHFDVQVCDSLAQAMDLARAAGGDGIVVLGGAPVCRAAHALLGKPGRKA